MSELAELRRELALARAELKALADERAPGETVVASASVSGGERQSVLEEAAERGRWLCALLVLQSASGTVLQGFEELISTHIVITFFLTMLVGAGGNCGNQSAIAVIRSLALGELQLDGTSFGVIMLRQARVGGLLAAATTSVGALRVVITDGDLQNIVGICASLWAIVFSSCMLGAALPFALGKLGVDPANAGTTIQVVMDVLGVTTTCAVCSLVFDFF